MRKFLFFIILFLVPCLSRSQKTVYVERDLKEVTVRPKRQRYTRKGNPAVELMRKVIEAKGDHNLEKNDYYGFYRYQRITTGLNNITQEMADSMRILSKTTLKNQVEFCPQTGKYILPMHYMEEVTHHLYRRSPKEERDFVLGTNSQGITDLFPIGDNINAVIGTMFTDVNIYPIIFNAVWGTTLALADDIAVSDPASVKGLKLGTDDPNLSKFLNSVGATPTFVIPPDYYSSITSGVVDGVINGMNVINIFGGLQPSKHVYMFENSASTSARCIAANLDTWNSLDDTLKAIFIEELTGDQYWTESVEYWTVSDQKHLDDAKGWGIPVDTISGDAMKAWVDGVRPYGDEMLQALRDRGCDKTDEVLKIWEDAIANYSGRFA